jgi:hypothetical protein
MSKVASIDRVNILSFANEVQQSDFTGRELGFDTVDEINLASYMTHRLPCTLVGNTSNVSKTDEKQNKVRKNLVQRL